MHLISFPEFMFSVLLWKSSLFHFLPLCFFPPVCIATLALTSLDSHASHYRSSPLCLFLLISVSVCVWSSVSNSPSWSVSWFSGLFVCCWFLPLSHFCLPVRTDYRVSNLFASKLSTILNKGCFELGFWVFSRFLDRTINYLTETASFILKVTDS